MFIELALIIGTVVIVIHLAADQPIFSFRFDSLLVKNQKSDEECDLIDKVNTNSDDSVDLR